MIKIAFNKHAGHSADISPYAMDTAKKARAFHSGKYPYDAS